MSADTPRMLIPDPVVGDDLKGFPESVRDLRLSEIGGQGLTLGDVETPMMTIDLGRVRHNERLLIGWAEARDILVAPHGKTTMSPALWESALDAGAYAITFATGWQVRAGFRHGVRRAMLANNLVDASAIRALSGFLDRTPDAELWVWADSVEATSILAHTLEDAGAARPFDVLIDLGAAGGRTGARGVEAALGVAEFVRAQPTLRLCGVAGYEGPFASDRSEAGVAAVGAYLDELGSLYARMQGSGLLVDEPAPIVTAGGSAYPDLVAERLGHLSDTARLIIRSGAFQVHDSGFYGRVSPFRRGAVPDASPEQNAPDALEPAIHVWARVISAPEDGLVLLDAGRRDLPVDIDLPVIEGMLGRGDLRIRGAEVTGVNDQHAFVRGSGVAELAVGDVVKLGVSHPCTAFDKWRAVAVVDDASAPMPTVTGALATLF